MQSIDETLSTIATKYFGTSVLNPKNEFHGNEIVHGKGAYKGRAIAERIALYKELLDAIDETEGLGRIVIRLDPSKMVAAKHENIAFMFLIEKVQDYMKHEQSLALLIADDDKEIAGTNVASLSEYKARGTDFIFGRAINRIVDTIHHTRSDHSRLLQLADIFVYTLAMVAGDCTTYFRREISAHARGKRRLLFPTKYKNWPTNDSWLSVG